MRLLGFEISRAGKPATAKAVSGELIPATPRGWFSIISEWAAGAWQKNLVVNDTKTLLAFSAVFACVSLISGDIAKLRLKVIRLQKSGVWVEGESSAFGPVIRKPNGYQTRVQFFQAWMISKLLWGNTYVLKHRDARGVVIAMTILDPQRTLPLVAPDGSVFYQVGEDNLSGLQEAMPAIPASEIIHDRGACLFHPLVGIPPLYACGASATQGNKIQTNAAKFFDNMSRPSGHLTAPGDIDDETAARLKRDFEEKFSGSNIGHILVTGSAMKFESFTMPPEQAQLIEQLRFTREDVATAFGVPLYKIGAGAPPSLGSVGALNQEYYQQALQLNIEAIEDLLDQGLGLPAKVGVEFDLRGLVRMDEKSRFETYEIGVRAGMLKPNEARQNESLEPVPGGDTPYMQQQNYSLAALAKRDSQEDPFGTAPPPAPAPPPEPAPNEPPEDAPDPNEEASALIEYIRESLECEAAALTTDAA